VGFTLDQLLETTGIDDLSGRRIEKTAAAKQGTDLLKLAERCRQAAEAQPEPEIDQRSIIEKVATVQVIRRALEEIREIETGQIAKTASIDIGQQAAFIKAALDEGHTPESIARFLENPPRKKKTATSIIG
jgi:hypothetical protein